MMKRMMHILGMAVMLLAALPVVSCHRSPLLEEDPAELSVNIYIPDVMPTKAETGSVGALDSEKIFSALQLWVFVSGGANDGQLVGYKGFTSAELASTGLPHSTVTRFGMPLSRDMFNLLSQSGTKVDVYAVANAASAGNASLGEGTTRAELDAIVITGTDFGPSPLTMAVPAAGLPMSGVLKGASVTGGYPVLNVSTVTLTRAVSKIRFVFCQQGAPASDTDPAAPTNPACVVKSITFGGTAAGHDCQIAASEKLFTNHKYGATDNPFEIDGYSPLSAVLAGEGGAPLMPNADMSIVEHPDQLLFRSPGHELESAREYENRLDAAVAASSQVGPIYIRETDKRISGTILYDTGEGEQTATFSMAADDVLCRNHSWILYAYFAEATSTLQFKIVVLPWDKSTYDFDFTTATVNVVRRFTITETDPATFKKEQTADGYYDIKFWHTLNSQPNVIKGDILIATPVGQKIHVVPVAGALAGATKVDGIFTVSPMSQVIYPNYLHPEDGRIEDCKVEFTISCNPGSHTDAELEGNYIDLHFCVEIGDNERWIDLDSESIDYYRIILKKNWSE
jgi:hypothetical protein